MRVSGFIFLSDVSGVEEDLIAHFELRICSTVSLRLLPTPSAGQLLAILLLLGPGTSKLQ
ncbi:hypothetical protein C369_03560 [Cryptococcus neoformans A5-35-17]|nr:hypothetical protein C369_03560 [Cryptococcus neoformans var. grubii A5-35-17]